jgi:hypothetical protein
MASVVATTFDTVDPFVLSGPVISWAGRNLVFSFGTTEKFLASLEMTG